MRFGDYELDLARYELRRSGRHVRVQPRVLDVLAHLIRNRERVVSKEELLESVWDGTSVSDTALTQTVKEARRAVRDDGARQSVIQTVRGRGYRFVARVEIPEPPLDPRVGSDPFVGRETLLALLGQELGTSLAGHGRAVFLTGEPGIGKSRAASELGSRAQSGGARLLLGRCVEGQTGPAYWPWTQVVRALLQQGLADLDRQSAGALARALPDVRTELRRPPAGGGPQLSDEEARFRVHDAVARLLCDAASREPLVVVLDDLQWADHASLRLLEFVLGSIGEARIFVVGTWREAEVARDPQRGRILGAVARNPGMRAIRLEGLTAANVAAFFQALTGRGISVGVAEALQDRTGGNPFFLTQIVRLWEDAGGGDPEELRKELPLPQGVREAIGRHLDVLTEACRDLLTRASVFGRGFELDLLAHVSGMGIDATLETLDDAFAARVVRGIGETFTRFEFAHALIPETLYEAMSPARRLRLHGRAGRALEALRGDDESRVSEIAYHLTQAAPLGASADAVLWCVKAARLATRQLAWEEAVVHYGQALEMQRLSQADAGDVQSTLLELGEAQVRVGEVRGARETFQRAAGIARERGDGEALARAALGLDWNIVREGSVGTDPLRLALLGEALGAIGPGESPLRVRLLAALDEALYFEQTPAAGPSMSLEAVEMARRLGDPDALVFALNRRHLLRRTPGGLQERLAISSEFVILARNRRDPTLSFDAYGNQIHDALEHGDVSTVDEALDAFERLAAERRIPRYLWYAELYGAMRALMEGSFERAEERIERAFAIGEQLEGELARLWHVVQTQALRVDQGRAAELLGQLRSATERYPVPALQLNLAWVEALTGSTGTARRLLDEVSRNGLTAWRRDITWTSSMAALARICDILGHRRAAEVVYEELHPFSRHHVVAGTAIVYRGSVSAELGRLAGRLGRFDEAASHFAVALERERRMGAKPCVASTLCDRAAMLLARGGSEACEQARRDLEEASRLAVGIGAGLHEERSRLLMERLGQS